MSGLQIASLFSGIGGLEGGLEEAGLGETVVQVEQDPFCREILSRRWPGIQQYNDVRTVGAAELGRPDVLCGGFPCQDISQAGRCEGIEGARSGLWSEFARIIGEVRPRIVVLENVAALLRNGMDRVLGDLATLGYDAEWDCIPASAIGAPHQRDRVFIVAYPAGAGLAVWKGTCRPSARLAEPERSGREPRHVAHANGQPRDQGRPRDSAEGQGGRNADRGRIGQDVADACGADCQPVAPVQAGQPNPQGSSRRGRRFPESITWTTEPDVGRVAHGVPSRVDRLRTLGNAVVPQVAEHVGGLIVNALRRIEADSQGDAPVDAGGPDA